MSKKELIKGNYAIALAAIKANVDAFFGYPITPQNEVPEYLSKMLPEAGKVFVQAESEIAAAQMVYGAAGAGKRVMTSSSSVGIALKQETFSYLCGSQLPCVIVSVMRAGPGLGGIQPSQGDYYQATRGGGNGDYNMIVYAPESIEETLKYIQEGFEVAEYYRNPVMVLVDGLIGQMMESVDLDVEVRKRTSPHQDWAANGMKNHKGRNIINSLFLDPQQLYEHNLHLKRKYDQMRKDEVLYELVNMEKADYVIVAYGTMARIARSAIQTLKKEGINVGMIRPITVWPFPHEAFDHIPKTCKGILTVELSMGQMLDDVLISNNGRYPVAFFGKAGGILIDSTEIEDVIRNFKKWVIKDASL
ncbi:MAG TPA: 3-methyl-2-oxobutanoate dehydrogenase subunit VorB [Acholeplasmataceae bacterium]|jgi:2-oxoglutarate ferredoxin oxidoreductase subunit alpha|nr:3-methyl-2-oxobutanoate dehydrogenase subunit VorB [Acholeplasmataceae bacterium]